MVSLVHDWKKKHLGKSSQASASESKLVRFHGGPQRTRFSLCTIHSMVANAFATRVDAMDTERSKPAGQKG